jgi:ankyrin repeat protein
MVLSAAHDLVDARDEDGYTPIHLAVIAGNKPLIKFLLSKNADVNSLDNERHSVVHWATGKLMFSVASFWSQVKNKILLLLLRISFQNFA